LHTEETLRSLGAERDHAPALLSFGGSKVTRRRVDDTLDVAPTSPMKKAAGVHLRLTVVKENP
jgi:hypothetical protein